MTRCCYSIEKVTVSPPSCAPGNVHSAEGWEELLLPEIERQQRRGKEVVFRADAAFAKPEIYEALEERDVKYAIRLPANDNLERDIAELLTRPVGRRSHKPLVWYKSFLYQAASWKTVRRVVAKVEFHFGELFPRVGFIVTNLAATSRVVVRFYNKRGTAEQWIKEGKQAVAMTRLSCQRFRANEVRLWLSLIAYNLGNLWRRLALPTRIDRWSLTSLQQRLVKTGGRLIKHARYYWLLLAESHLARRLFAGMLRKNHRVAGADGIAGCWIADLNTWTRPSRKGAVCEESSSKTVDSALRVVDGRNFGHAWLPGGGDDRETGQGVDAAAAEGLGIEWLER